MPQPVSVPTSSPTSADEDAGPASAVRCVLVHNDADALVLDEQINYVIGRDPRAVISIDDRLASRVHASIRFLDRRWQVNDEDSRNGTFVNRHRLTASWSLEDKDVIQIGGHQFIFLLLPAGTDPQSLLGQGQGASGATVTMELTETDQTTRQAASFAGCLHGNSLVELCRFFQETRKTGLMEIDGDSSRQIWFIDGTPRAAFWGEACGLEALGRLDVSVGRAFAFFEHRQCECDWNLHGPPSQIFDRLQIGIDGRSFNMDANDLASAGDYQSSLLNAVPSIGGFEFGWFYRAHTVVGGDFYDVGRMRDDRHVILIGDVSGHGLQSAMVVSGALQAWRMLRRQHHCIKELLVAFNDVMREDLLKNQFITMAVLACGNDSDVVECSLAGHHHYLLRRHSGSIDTIGRWGLAIGMAPHDLFAAHVSSVEVSLSRGDVLLQCTDGVMEIANSQGEQFGDQRLAAWLAGPDGLRGSQSLVDGLASAALEFGQVDKDDITIVALRRED